MKKSVAYKKKRADDVGRIKNLSTYYGILKSKFNEILLTEVTTPFVYFSLIFKANS